MEWYVCVVLKSNRYDGYDRSCNCYFSSAERETLERSFPVYDTDLTFILILAVG